MKRIKMIITCCILLTAAAAFLLLPNISINAISKGLQICSTAILPSLFPFFVITNLWNSLGYGQILSNSTSHLMQKVFHLPGQAASAWILGSIGGYPVGAQTAAMLYKSGSLTKKEAEQTLMFCNNAGPAFVFGVLGSGIFQSNIAGLTLFLIHIGSAMLIGILFRPPETSQANSAIPKCFKPLRQALPDAVHQAGATAFQICIFVLFFAVITDYLNSLFPLHLLSAPIHCIFFGALELAGGARLLAEASLTAVGKFCIASFLLGWGGICVLFQTLSILKQAGLSGRIYLFGKTLQALLSLLAAMLTAPFLPLPENCSIGVQIIWSYSVQQIIFLTFIAVILLVFLKISSGKYQRNRI